MALRPTPVEVEAILPTRPGLRFTRRNARVATCESQRPDYRSLRRVGARFAPPG